jgi:hypothetical protein
MVGLRTTIAAGSAAEAITDMPRIICNAARRVVIVLPSRPRQIHHFGQLRPAWTGAQGLVDLADMRMIQRGDRARFLLESGAVLSLEPLDRGDAPEP